MPDQFGLPPIKRPVAPRPLVVDGVKYSVRLSHPAPGRTRGQAQAHDARTGALRWSVTLFEDTSSEDDGPIGPPRVFVSLEYADGALIVKISPPQRFVISLTGKQIFL